MATLPFIKFDASLKDNIVGIGIYNCLTKDIFKSYYKINTKCSLIAEKMALVECIRYMSNNKIYSAHLFTDSLSLSKEEISINLINKYLSKILIFKMMFHFLN